MKILFTHKKSLSTFMRQDVDCLQANGHEVISYCFTEIKRPYHLTAFIRQAWHLLTHRYEVYYCYFADYHSLLPVLYGWLKKRQTVVVAAGYDAFNLPDFNYGIFQAAKWRQRAARIIYKRAGKIVAVSAFITKNIRLNTGTTKPITIIPISIQPPDAIKRDDRENFVLTVGIANDMANYFRKGYDMFYSLAERMPDVQFLSIGNKAFKHPELPNVRNVDYLPHILTKRHMKLSKVYVQLSRAEGVPFSFLEAMANGCYCVGTNTGAMPEMADENSMIVDYDEFYDHIEEVEAYIRDAFRMTEPNYAANTKAWQYHIADKRKLIRDLLINYS